MKNQIKKILYKFGFNLPKTQYGNTSSVEPNANSAYRLFEYRKPDGTFDYQRYRQIQQEGNIKKLENIWVIEDNIKFLANYLRNHLSTIHFGICHGTRRGNEQAWFRKYLGCDVIGTEISETATQFENTVQWDFHKPNADWEGKTDFIYSNSFDHSYDPENCLNTWINTLRPGGYCILEHSNMHAPEGADELDPFGAELEIMPYLITKWGKGKYYLRDLLEAPFKHQDLKTLSFLVIQRKPV